MTKHYVLSVNPSAEYEWDRCTLRDPITAERPELAQLITEAIGGRSGSYLISVTIQVDVLEQVPLPQNKPVPLNKVDSHKVDNHVQPKEKVA